jgi:uncharacterized protein (UPF0262 family)
VSDPQRIVKIVLDERGLIRRSPQIEHERKVAIYDLIEENRFAVVGFEGPTSCASASRKTAWPSMSAMRAARS